LTIIDKPTPRERAREINRYKKHLLSPQVDQHDEELEADALQIKTASGHPLSGVSEVLKKFSSKRSLTLLRGLSLL
jgi:hypothetical protein